MKVISKFKSTNDEGKIEYLTFILITGLLLLTYGPINYATRKTDFIWFEVIFYLCVVVLLLFVYSKISRIESNLTTYINVCYFYTVIILAAGLIHWIALLMLDEHYTINVVNKTALYGKITIYLSMMMYLFFPVSFILQIFLYRKISLERTGSPLAFFVLINICVIYYQGFFDKGFFNNWQPWTGQVCGLFGDPNWFSLSFFLLTLNLLAFFFLTQRLDQKLCIVSVFAASFGGMLLAGGRTVVGGIVLLGICWPIILLLAQKNWSLKKKMLAGSSPVLFITIGILSMPFVVPIIENFGIAGRRIAETYAKILHSGVGGLFSGTELRGELFTSGLSLLKKSTSGGWGPGGFYIEYPNEKYVLTGNLKESFDMLLNHYLMIAVDFGVPFLVLNLFLISIPLVGAIYYLQKENLYINRLVVAILLVGNCIFLIMISVMPPTYGPPVIWLWAGQLAYLVVLANGKGFFTQNIFIRHKKLVFVLCLTVLFSTIVGGYQTSFGSKGYLTRHTLFWWNAPKYFYGQGCYPVDYLGDGTPVQWCQQNSLVQIPVPEDHIGTEYDVLIDNQYPDLRKNPVLLQYGGKSGTRSEILIREKGIKRISVPMDEEHSFQYRLSDGRVRKYVVLSLNPSRTWIPKKHGVGNDDRELGVQVIFPR
jgi:hypothetical protein